MYTRIGLKRPKIYERCAHNSKIQIFYAHSNIWADKKKAQKNQKMKKNKNG